MAMEYMAAWCKDCGQKIRGERQGTNHILWLLISVFTMGIGLIFWLLAAIKIGGWSCPHCGGTNVSTHVYKYVDK